MLREIYVLMALKSCAQYKKFMKIHEITKKKIKPSKKKKKNVKEEKNELE